MDNGQHISTFEWKLLAFFRSIVLSYCLSLNRLIYDIFFNSLYIELCDGKKTSTHLGKNRLDKERIKVITLEVVSHADIIFIN